MRQNAFAAGDTPRAPLGKLYNAPPDSLAGFGEGNGEEEWKGLGNGFYIFRESITSPSHLVLVSLMLLQLLMNVMMRSVTSLTHDFSQF